MYHRYRRAIEHANYYTMQGKHIYSPVIHNHMIRTYSSMGTEWSYWKDLCFNMLDRCDEFWVLQLEGWDASVEVKAETDFAIQKQIPILYIEPIIRPNVIPTVLP